VAGFIPLGYALPLSCIGRPLHLKFPVVSVLWRAGVFLATHDDKILPANNALSDLGRSLRALFAAVRRPFFLICQVIFVSVPPPVFLEMFRRAGLGALPVIKFLPADCALFDDGALTLALLCKDCF
jgi:hypothetical protein